MKSGLAVVGICLLIGSIGGVFLLWNTQTRIRESQDIVLALTYFMEQHEGRLPASKSEFLESDFVISVRSTDGKTAIRVKPYEESQYRRDPHGVLISDLDQYQVAWGTDLSNLTYDAQGDLRDPKGNGVKLIRWPALGYGSGSSAPARYGDLIYSASQDIRKRITDQPTSAPSTK